MRQQTPRLSRQTPGMWERGQPLRDSLQGSQSPRQLGVFTPLTDPKGLATNSGSRGECLRLDLVAERDPLMEKEVGGTVRSPPPAFSFFLFPPPSPLPSSPPPPPQPQLLPLPLSKSPINNL